MIDKDLLLENLLRRKKEREEDLEDSSKDIKRCNECLFDWPDTAPRHPGVSLEDEHRYFLSLREHSTKWLPILEEIVDEYDGLLTESEVDDEVDDIDISVITKKPLSKALVAGFKKCSKKWWKFYK